MQPEQTSLEAQLAAVTAARDGVERELDSLRARIASADALHKRWNQRESEHQKAIDALAAAESNLKAARTAEFQATTRAATAEAALTRGGAVASPDGESLLALQKQLGESRRLESAATTEAAELRARLADVRAQMTALATKPASAPQEDEAGKAKRELQAVIAQNAVFRHDLDNARTRITQLEAAAVTLQARQTTGPSPELLETRIALDKARNAVRSSEGNASRLRKDVTDARTRITALESTLAATRAASAANITAGAELEKVRAAADRLRSDLLAVTEENRRLKRDQAPRPARPPREGKPAADAPASPAPAPAGETPAPASSTAETSPESAAPLS